MWSSPCRRDGEVEKSALRAVSSLSPEGERVGVRGGALFKGKEGRGDFRRILIDFIKVAKNIVIIHQLP